MTARLNVNIDHVATVRQARHAPEPSVVAAAMICEQAGADGKGARGHELPGPQLHRQVVDEVDFRVERKAALFEPGSWDEPPFPHAAATDGSIARLARARQPDRAPRSNALRTKPPYILI